jgi:hypothetical protein
MAGASSYAVLLRDAGRPDAEPIRRAFSIFSHLTDADAIRLAANAQGILLRHLGADEGRALLRALQTEGVPAALVNEAELYHFAACQTLTRLELHPEKLTGFDQLGQPHELPWADLLLVAAGAVPRVEIHSRTAARSLLETKPQFLLVLVTAAQHYEISARPFNFASPPDHDPMAVMEKLAQLIRNITDCAPQALQNRAVRDIRNGINLLRGYPSPQALRDEMSWLLWQAAQRKRTS